MPIRIYIEFTGKNYIRIELNSNELSSIETFCLGIVQMVSDCIAFR